MKKYALCLLVAPAFVQAADTPPQNTTNDTDFSIGVAGSLDVTPYKGKMHHYSVLPVINYDDDTWFISGNEAGYYLWNDDTNELKIKAIYDGHEFNPKDTHGAYRRLHSRHSTVLAGLSYQHVTSFGALRAQIAADTLDHSNGITGNLAWLYQYQNHGWTLVPEVGLDWANAQQNRYYYGVSAKEYRRSGIRRYNPNASVTPYVGMTADYAFSRHWDTYVSGRSEWLSSTLRDSPMVARGYAWSMTLGVNYNF